MTSKKFYKLIGQRIKEYRAQSGLSQLDLCKKLRVRQNELSRWETGTYRIQVIDLVKVAKHLDVSLWDLLPSND